MSDTPDPTTAPPPRPVPGVVKLLVGVGLAFGLYQAVMFGVRQYVDSRIEKSVGTTVPDFAVVDLDGKTWRASELRGSWLVLHFFRSQCSQCVAERGAIKEFEQRIDPLRVRLLGVLMDRVEGYPEATTRATLALLDYHHPVLAADTGFADAFHGAGWAHVTPVTYVIDPAGRIVQSLRGRQDVGTLLGTLPPDTLLPR